MVIRTDTLKGTRASAPACSEMEGGPIKRNTTNMMTVRGTFRQEESGEGSPRESEREVSVKVGGPTRSSFSFSDLRGSLALRAAGTKFIIRYLGPGDTPRQKRGDYPRRRGCENCPAESRSLSRAELTFCQIYDACTAAEDNGGSVLITGVAQVYLSSSAPFSARFLWETRGIPLDPDCGQFRPKQEQYYRTARKHVLNSGCVVKWDEE